MFDVGLQSGCVDSCWRRPLMNWMSIVKVGLLCQMTTCLLRDDPELQMDVLRSDSRSARPIMGREDDFEAAGFEGLSSRSFSLGLLRWLANGVWMPFEIKSEV